jgi:predicted RNase H-like HicB family nuclease
MANIIKINDDSAFIEIQLSVLVVEQGKFYVAYCPSLDLSSYGNSVEDAKLAFDETLKGYVEYAIENGTLHDDLVEHGWKIGNVRKAEPPEEVDLDNIPTGNLKKQFNESLCIPAF